MRQKMNLNDIVNDYSSGTPGMERELKWFREQPNLKAAIECAAFAINCKGKKCPHQCRIKKVALENGKNALLMNSKEINQVKSFHDLFLLIKGLCKPISGLGELYVYDTSLRIGAWLNLLPTKVYLHAGTRAGARALGFDIKKVEAIEVSEMPKAFQKLKPHELEDVLCIYLRPSSGKNKSCLKKDLVTKRSRCE